MKKRIVSRIVLAGMALLTVPFTGIAQKEKDKKEKESQTIVITREPGEGKTVIEIDGDKVKVNGKDAKDSKDVNVHVTTIKPGKAGLFMRNSAPHGEQWNMTMNDDFISLFEEDNNRGMLGIQMESHDKGALVKSVTKESAAEKAGLKAGDIITKIGDKKIEDADDVTTHLKKHKPGEKVAVTYLRDSKEHQATAELMKWKGIKMDAMNIPRVDMKNFDGPSVYRTPFENFGGTAYAFGGRPKLGVSIQDTEDGKGVKVLDVEEDGNAAKAGIKKNDIILAIDDKEVNSTSDVTRLVRGAERDNYKYSMRVLRDGKTQTIEVKIPRKLKTADL
jgi:serine protease Do